MASERGQASAEMVALAALAAALALVSAGVPARLAEAVEGHLCAIAGLACTAHAAEREPVLTPQQQRAAGLGPSRWGEPAPGTPEERIAVRTPPPPAGDQCSHSPDRTRIYDFSYACYGHDICWQLGTYGGATVGLPECNRIFLGAMRDHCERRHAGRPVRRRACRAAARTYYAAVEAAAYRRRS
jgi:hypothetical protein